MHLAVEVPVVDCAITNVITAYRNINDKVGRAIKTKVHKLDIALLVACGRRRRHLVVDAHRVACVAGQLRQDIHDMIVASGDSCVLFASKHVMVLKINRQVLARAHHPSHSMRLKHRHWHAHGSAEEAHPKVQTEVSDRSFFQQALQNLPAGRRGRHCRSAENAHCAHLLELPGSATHSEASSILRSLRVRHDRAHIDDLSNAA